MAGIKSQVIKLHLIDKLNDWVKSIKDESLQKMVRADTIVSGGAIASMLLGEKVNDYDLYFRTKETALAVANYYTKLFNETNRSKALGLMSTSSPQVKEMKRTNIKGAEEDRIVIYMKSAGVASETQEEYNYYEGMDEISADQFMDQLKSETSPIEVANELHEITKEKDKPYRPVFFSENAITLSKKVQLVVRFYGTPSEIHENYDFAHAMCYFDWSKNELSLHPEALESLLSKTLRYKGSLYPMASLFRIRKFIERGWRISAGQMLTIVWQLNALDLQNSQVLREQLLGVDQAYFHQLLRALENKDGNQRVDATYVAKLVDEIFE